MSKYMNNVVQNSQINIPKDIAQAYPNEEPF